MKTCLFQGRSKLLSAIMLIGLSLFFWTKGFHNSPMWRSKQSDKIAVTERSLTQQGSYSAQEEHLAKDYWLRYKDIKEDYFWGINGPKGIGGPRHHYLVHGKREGRIFQPVNRPSDLEKEARFAEAYWQRYPLISKSSIWGRQSQLGILGPRDHFDHLGKGEGRLWTIQPTLNTQKNFNAPK